MKVCTGCGMRRITIRIMGFSRNLGWDDGNKRKFGRSRLQDWAEIWVKMTGLDKPIRDLVGGEILVNRPFGHCAEGVYGQFYTIYKAKPRFDLLLFSGSPAWKVYYTTYKFQTAIAVSWNWWKILFIIVCVQRVLFIVCLTVVGSKPVNHEWGSWYANQ